MPATAHEAFWLQQVMDAWAPNGKRLCGNCLHAQVSGDPDTPMVRCAWGHGKPVKFFAVIRSKNPRGPAGALHCADFTSMDDD